MTKIANPMPFMDDAEFRTLLVWIGLLSPSIVAIVYGCAVETKGGGA